MTSIRLRAGHGHQLASSRTAAISSRGATVLPGSRLARLGQQDERHRPLPDALLVAGGGHDNGIRIDLLIERTGSPRAASSSADLLAQSVLARQPQRGEQPERDRLPVPVGGIAGHGLDRVTDGVAEIEDLAHAVVALVAGDDPQLGLRAGGDHARLASGPHPPRTMLPQRGRRRSAPS